VEQLKFEAQREPSDESVATFNGLGKSIFDASGASSAGFNACLRV
jgi:hypothetical protein